MSTTAELRSLRRALLAHFDAHARSLPWRADTEPYRVWVSEIMLQQTRVETATPYFQRWMERFPSLAELAEAEEEEVLKAWEGLGYYSRARNLHRAARVVRERLSGRLPNTARALRELPGIGEYSAGAIASICHQEAIPAVDGNARRVISRLFDLARPSPAELREKALEMLDRKRPGDWNQAIMDLGATICLPRSPRCSECPVMAHCAAWASGTQEMRPLKKPRRHQRKTSFAVLVAERAGGAFLLARRPARGLLGGLWEFPSVEMDTGASDRGVEEACRTVADRSGIAVPSSEVGWQILPPVRHHFSHLDAVYRPALVRGASWISGDAGAQDRSPGSGAEERSWRWVTPDEALSVPLPVAQRKIMALAREELDHPGFGPSEAPFAEARPGSSPGR